MKQFWSEVLVLGVMVFPVASIVASLVDLAWFLMGEREVALWICGITWGTTMVLVPVARWILSGPDTRVERRCGRTPRPYPCNPLQER
jgi:hypothetical protein